MAGLGGSGGSGGSAGEIEAGRAAVVVGLKDETAAGLKKLQSKLADFSQTAAKVTGGSTGDLFDKAGKGGFGTLGVVGVVAGLKEMTKYADGFAPALFAARKEMERIEASAKSAGYFLDRVSLEFEKSLALAAPGSEGGLVAQQLAGTKKMLKDLEDDDLAKAKAARDSISGRSGVNIALRERFLGEDTRAEFKDAEATVRSVLDRMNAVQKKVDELEKKKKELKDPFEDAGFLKSFRGLGDEMKGALDPATEAMGEFEKKFRELMKAVPEANEAARAKLEAAVAEAKKTDKAIADKAFGKTLDEFQRGMGRALLTDPGLKAMGEWEQRVRDFIEANPGMGAELTAKLERDATAVDARLKKWDNEKAFAGALGDARFGLLTAGMSGEDQQLAQLVKQDFSNDQILKLRAVQQQLAAQQKMGAGGPGTFAAGGMAGSSLALSLGVATSWQRNVENAVELTAERLNILRNELVGIKQAMGFK